MKRLNWLILLTVFMMVPFLQAREAEHRLGLLEQDPREIPWMHQANIVPAENLPASVMNLAYLPPVGNQGSQGSCTAWAVAYYFKTYQEAKEKQWDPSLPEHQCSPAFVYNQINGGKDAGSFIGDAFKCLEDMGCGTMQDMPYNPNDFSSWPNEMAYENGIPFRTQSTNFILTSNDAGINAIKTVLNSGEILVIGINVYGNFDNIAAYNYTYCVNDVSGNLRGGHAVTIIGYDDTRVTSDGVGAFYMVNSWGTGWGMNGFWWMSYQAVKSSLLCHGYAYYAYDRIGYQPELLARFQISHSRRESLEFWVGVGSTLSPLWEKKYFDWYMPTQAYHPAPTTRIVLDASDGAAQLTPGSQPNFYLKIKDAEYDGVTGSLNYFRGELYSPEMNATANNLPINIPDGYSLPLGIAIGGQLSVAPLKMDFGEVTMGNSLQKTFELNNMGSDVVTLSVHLEPGSTYFSATDTTVTLQPGEVYQGVCTYSPPEQGEHFGKITVSGVNYVTKLRLHGISRGTLALTPESYDFGQVTVGDTSWGQFSVNNTGSSDETITVQTVGDDAAHFTASPTQFTLPPGQSQTITVAFHPLSAEDKQAYLKISAPGQNDQSQLTGYGIGVPALEVGTAAVTRSLLVGDSMLAILPLRNVGTAYLSFQAVLSFSGPDTTWAELWQSSGHIIPGGEKKLILRLRGHSAGWYTATCQITTNEPGSNSYQVPVNLKVVEVPANPHFVPVFSGTPYTPMMINLVHAEWNGAELEAGDEIAVYDANLCVGTVLLHHTVGYSVNTVTILAGADDPATTEIDGFIEGHDIQFRVWDADAGQEYVVSQVEFLTSTGNAAPVQPFTANGMAFISLGTMTDISHHPVTDLPRSFVLEQNYPNPFNPTTTIGFDLPEACRVELVIYDISGRTIRTLARGGYAAGRHQVVWDGTDERGNSVASGVYVYRLVAGEHVFVRKMVLMK